MSTAMDRRIFRELSLAIILLSLHGILTQSEREQARERLDGWALENNIERQVAS